MKLVKTVGAESDAVKIEVKVSVETRPGHLTKHEAVAMSVNLASAAMRSLTAVPYTAFSLCDVKVKP